jgi:hypothetical protein
MTIYGPDIAALKGKTTRLGAAQRAPNFAAVVLPPSVLEHHRNVTLCVDFFFVQVHIFYHEFACIRDDVHPAHVDIVPADSHVGEVERSIRTVKERLRACVHGLPFTRLPKIMIAHMVVDVVRCLNMFPAAHGISATLSPLSLVTGVPSPDYNHLRLEFGSYVQLFADNDPSNTIRAACHRPYPDR